MLMPEGASSHPSAARHACVAHHTARLPGFQRPGDAPADQPLETVWKNLKHAGTQLQSFPTCEALQEQVEQTRCPCEPTPAASLALCRLPTEMAKVASMCLLRKSFA